jgi:hypothetical protein
MNDYSAGSRSFEAPISAEDLSPRIERLSRILKDLGSMCAGIEEAAYCRLLEESGPTLAQRGQCRAVGLLLLELLLTQGAPILVVHLSIVE